jgi:formate-dependent nitrite reductase membrane component NrfD
LWTKGVGAGALLVAALAVLLDVDLGKLGTIVAPAIGLAGVTATGILLVTDLKRPERFYYILTKPNPKSWLFLGSIALGAFGAVCAAWLGVGILAENGSIDDPSTAFNVLAAPAILAAVAVAGYTGFLFGQAEGRDLWQSPLLFWHLIVQAVMVGAGALAVAAPAADLDADAQQLVVRCLVLGAVAHVLMLLLEYGGRHTSKQAAAAAHLVTHGPYARTYWTGGIALAVVSAAVAAVSWNGDTLALAVISGLAVQAALLAYESVFVRAGQDVPLS